MKNNIIRIIFALLLMIIITAGTIIIPEGRATEAATTYITVEAFSKALADEIGIYSVSGSQLSGYVNALIEKGIIKEDDFSSYTGYLTRGDAAVLLNRADEYLYGDKLDPELVQLALEKRISDINKVKESKRLDVVKCYLKGYIKGYSNGTYSTDRAMKGSSKITKDGALSCIKMLQNKNLRAKISPDGQLIRTTKLPKYAKYFPYVLASFPNEYYDWKFDYEWYTWRENGKPIELVNLEDYAAPKDVDKVTYHGDFKEIKKERLDTWIEEAKIFMNNLLNVDYRTMNEEWIDMMIESNDAYSFNDEMVREYMEEYLQGMKKNKTVVECASVDIDGSSLYYFHMTYYLRVHVKYRVISSVVSLNMEINDLNETWAHNNILFSQYFVNLRKSNLNEWHDGYYEILLANYADGISGSMVRFDDAMYRGKKVSE
ncbi:MAG: hypothetical protein K0S76_2277 [Herbinix sp.]|nr:hypothetical protein [Herbinix sp.]